VGLLLGFFDFFYLLFFFGLFFVLFVGSSLSSFLGIFYVDFLSFFLLYLTFLVYLYCVFSSLSESWQGLISSGFYLVLGLIFFFFVSLFYFAESLYILFVF